jgi:hypothetical protein
MGWESMRLKHQVGDYVRISRRGHPHYGRLGTITEEAEGSPRSVGLDWLIKLEHEHIGEEGCYATDDEVEVWPSAER